MARETLRSRIVRFTRRWRLRAAAVLLAAGAAWILVPWNRSRPAPTPAAAPVARSAPPAPVRVVEPMPERLRLASECVRRRELKAPAAEIEEIDRKFESHLGTLPPAQVVGMLSSGASGVVVPILLRGLDNGLASDRPGWERALAEALAEASGDPARREGLGGIFFSRVRDENLRGSAALSLASVPEGGPVLSLAAREAPPAARPVLRRLLWARLDAPGAVEALGEIVEPAEADRLASVGPRPDVRRALQSALARSGDPAFRSALDRLSR